MVLIAKGVFEEAPNDPALETFHSPSRSDTRPLCGQHSIRAALEQPVSLFASHSPLSVILSGVGNDLAIVDRQRPAVVTGFS
jgi:hypothetical protein